MLEFGNILKKPQPMSNTERQRRFRERNPGYYGRLHAKRKAKTGSFAAIQQTLAAARESAVAVETPMVPTRPIDSVQVVELHVIFASA